jgi:drug/metabolite transporter (DMT)-like permease|tara:strand:- start:1611 stop:2498 length:888 start_codon:yes stop_codon:yes gene_type:complete
MSKSASIISALLCTFIWGTTFIAQDTGMENIGPYVFNSVRFFVGFIALIPFYLFLEKKNTIKIITKNKKRFLILSFSIGVFLFFASVFQQVALLYTDVANAAFFTIFYVPMVPIIVFFLFKKKIHWSVWPSVVLCVIGGYFLTNFQDTTVRLGDTLVIICALFWSLHIIFIGIIIEEFNAPILIGLIQTFVVSVCSLIPGLIFEEFVLVDILSQKIQILYAGVLSGGIAFVLQIYAQKNIQPAPSAIIFSLEGVFATAAAWIILSQILNFNNILGCTFILIGVLISQLVPEIKKN